MATQYNVKAEIGDGDLIEIDSGFYQHWAVYVGDGFIVHLVPPSEVAEARSSSSMSVVSVKALVKKEKLNVVVGTKKWKVNNSLDKKYKPHPANNIVKNACALVNKWLPYNLFDHNCEHFANGMRYGALESRQVQEIGEAAMLLGGAAAFGVAAAVGVALMRPS